MSSKTLVRLTAAVLILAAVFLFFKKALNLDLKIFKLPVSLTEVLKKRPAPLRHVYDFAGKLPYGSENHESQLDHFEKKYGVEAVVVTIPSLGGRDIKTVAAEMFSNWAIGQRFGQKGLLLLVAFKERELKLEVGYGAEAVFTDLFCGYIERMALQPFFQAGHFSEGLLSIWEHFIARADDTLTKEQMKAYLGIVSPYASGGAGVKDIFQRKNSAAAKPLSREEQEKFVPQRTPEALVEMARETCRLCVQSGAANLMTGASQVMIREINREPSRLQCDNGLKAWSGPYEILRDGNHAVAMFSTTDKAQPIMMEKGEQGWLLDVFHMRRHAWFDHNNKLFIKGKDFPYGFAFKKGKYASIPRDDYAYEYGLLSPADEGYPRHFERLKEGVKKNPKDPKALLELSKFYIDLTLQTQAADGLAQVIRLAPNEADAYRYMAYLQFDLLGAPQQTLLWINRYLKLRPGDRKILLWKARSEERLGHYMKAAEALKTYCGDDEKNTWCLNYLGYYYFSAGQKNTAQGYFQKALKQNPNSVYARRYLQKIEKKTS